jgi:hypothetical protein
MEELPERWLSAGQLELIAPREVGGMSVDEYAVETLLDEVPQDPPPVLNIDAVKLGGRVDERAQRVQGRRLR